MARLGVAGGAFGASGKARALVLSHYVDMYMFRYRAAQYAGPGSGLRSMARALDEIEKAKMEWMAGWVVFSLVKQWGRKTKQTKTE